MEPLKSFRRRGARVESDRETSTRRSRAPSRAERLARLDALEYVVTAARADAPGDVLAAALACATLRARVARTTPEEQVRAIAELLRRDGKLVRDDPASEVLRARTLRAMPQSIAVKRSVKLRLRDHAARTAGGTTIGCWKWFKYRSILSFSRMFMTFRDTMNAVELWQDVIKSITGHYGSGIATYFIFLRRLIILNIIACVLSIFFIVLPQSLDSAYKASNISVIDFFTGSGFFADTIMYYGFYGNTTVEKIPGYKYSIPLAYLLTMFCTYVFIFVVLCVDVARSYRKCSIEASGTVPNFYANKIFCGWDFNISSPKVAGLWSAALHRELKEILAERQNVGEPSWCAKFGRLLVRLGVTALSLSMALGAAVSLWPLLNEYGVEEIGSPRTMIVPAVVTLVMNVFPVVISCLTKWEKYENERTALYATVIRVHVLAVAMIGTLLAFWLTKSTSDCWQSHLGEEIYRLILVDLLVSAAVTLLGEMARCALRDKLPRKLTTIRFDIAGNVLSLTYNQTLFWLGLYFSPLAPLAISAKMILVFYAKRRALRRRYNASTSPWRAAQTRTLFLALAFLGMVCAIATIGYVVTDVRCDRCGPFSAYNYTWEFVVEEILALDREGTLARLFGVVARPVTVAAILIAMCVGVYCLRAKVEASKETLRILREMLLMQSRDKKFLVREFNKLTEPNDDDESEGSPNVR